MIYLNYNKLIIKYNNNMQTKKYNLYYKIPQTRHQRGNQNGQLLGITKEDAKDWTAWILSKQGSYTLKSV